MCHNMKSLNSRNALILQITFRLFYEKNLMKLEHTHKDAQFYSQLFQQISLLLLNVSAANRSYPQGATSVRRALRNVQVVKYK